VTKVFSTAQVLLIVDVTSTLEELWKGMIAAHNDQKNDVATVVHVACQAGVMLINKYSTFAQDCKIYIIAIGMSYILFIFKVPCKGT